MQNQPTAAETIQNILGSEQQLLARRGALAEQMTEIDRELSAVRAALQGIQLGQRLAAEQAAPPEATPAPEATTAVPVTP